MDLNKIRPFVSRPDGMHVETLAELLVAVAYDIEQALLKVGAGPEQDYTRLDLIRLACSLVGKRWNACGSVRLAALDDPLAEPVPWVLEEDGTGVERGEET